MADISNKTIPVSSEISQSLSVVKSMNQDGLLATPQVHDCFDTYGTCAWYVSTARQHNFIGVSNPACKQCMSHLVQEFQVYSEERTLNALKHAEP